MPTIERDVLMQKKDGGNINLFYPVTRKANVLGIDDIEAELDNQFIEHEFHKLLHLLGVLSSDKYIIEKGGEFEDRSLVISAVHPDQPTGATWGEILKTVSKP